MSTMEELVAVARNIYVLAQMLHHTQYSSG